MPSALTALCSLNCVEDLVGAFLRNILLEILGILTYHVCKGVRIAL